MAWGVGLRVPAAAVAERLAGEGAGELSDFARAAWAGGAGLLCVDDGSSPSGASDPDPYVVLGGLSVHAPGIDLGCLATPIDERSPAILAKAVTALDVCSGGRAICAVSPGPPGVDPAPFGEALEVIRAMLRGVAPSMAGRHHRIVEAWNEPTWPRRVPVPVVVLLPEVLPEPSDGLLASVARHADRCVLRGDDRVAECVVTLRRAASRAGRLPGELGLFVLVDARTDRIEATELAELGLDGIVLDWGNAPLDGEMVQRAVRAGFLREQESDGST